jgi:hypothetical protein
MNTHDPFDNWGVLFSIWKYRMDFLKVQD